MKKKLKGLYLPFVEWGVLFVLLHNLFYLFGWYPEQYSIIDTLKHTLSSVMFAGVEGLVIPTWYLQSLFKGLLMTYAICLIPKRWIQWTLVILLYALSCYFDHRQQHLFYSMNRDMGVVIAIYIGYRLKQWNHILTWWQTLLCAAVLMCAAQFITIDLVGGVMGVPGAFPILTLLGVLMVYNIVRCLNGRKLFNLLSWYGRNSLYVLILHFTGFHILSSILVALNVAPWSELTGMTTLSSINHNIWWIPYTLAGLALPTVYVLLKGTMIKKLK